MAPPLSEGGQDIAPELVRRSFWPVFFSLSLRVPLSINLSQAPGNDPLFSLGTPPVKHLSHATAS